MPRESISEQIVETVSAIEEARVLLGFMEEIEARRWMELDYSVRNRWGPQISRDEAQTILEEEWEDFQDIHDEATSGLESPPPFVDSAIQLEDLPETDEVQRHLDEFTSGEYFSEMIAKYQDDSWKIKLVPIESLVAFQSHISTESYQDIPTSDDDYLEYLEYCLPIDDLNYVMSNASRSSDKSASARVVSRSPNLNFEGPIIEEIEDRPPGNISVSFQIKARPNFIQVHHYYDRYILANGYHRSFKLLQEGETHIPAVVIDMNSYEQTAAYDGSWFNRNKIMGQRPPLVHDFETDVAVNLEVKGSNTVIQIDAQKMDVER